MLKRKLLVAWLLSVSLVTSGIGATSVLTTKKAEAAEKTATQIWGDAKWYYNNQNYYNAVYFGDDAIKKGYKGTDKESFMQKAGQALFNSATASSDQKDYKLAYKHYNLVATASGISAALKKDGAKYAEISKMRAEQPDKAQYFNQAQWYLNQKSYYNALYFFTRTIESGWDTPLMREYVNTSSSNLLEDAKYSMQVDNKQDALESAEVLIANAYVPSSTKSAASKLKADILNPANFSTTEKQLMAKGYPVDALIALSTEQEKDLISEDATYVSTEGDTESSSTLLEEPTSEDANQVTTTSGISVLSKSSTSKIPYVKDGKYGLKNFYHVVIVSKVKPKGSGKYKGMPSMKLSYIIDWRETPLWTLSDKVGLTWNKDYMVDGETPKFQYTYYTYRQKYVTPLRSGQSSLTDQSSSGNGVGWKYDIKGDNGNIPVVKHHVEASVTIRNDKLESFSYAGRYFHKIVSVSGGSLEFGSGGANIGISFSSSYTKSNPFSKLFNAKNYK